MRCPRESNRFVWLSVILILNHNRNRETANHWHSRCPVNRHLLSVDDDWYVQTSPTPVVNPPNTNK
jgi:hypothetical protein